LELRSLGVERRWAWPGAEAVVLGHTVGVPSEAAGALMAVADAAGSWPEVAGGGVVVVGAGAGAGAGGAGASGDAAVVVAAAGTEVEIVNTVVVVERVVAAGGG
jgi:hypothetical protein